MNTQPGDEPQPEVAVGEERTTQTFELNDGTVIRLPKVRAFLKLFKEYQETPAGANGKTQNDYSDWTHSEQWGSILSDYNSLMHTMDQLIQYYATFINSSKPQNFNFPHHDPEWPYPRQLSYMTFIGGIRSFQDNLAKNSQILTEAMNHYEETKSDANLERIKKTKLINFTGEDLMTLLLAVDKVKSSQ